MNRGFRFAALIALLAPGAPAFAQETTGSIAGVIEDRSKAVLPGASLTVSSPALIGTKAAVTNERGEYAIRLLPPGIYVVSATMPGFADVARQNIEVRVGQTATVNLQMGPAGVSETLNVRAEAPVIDVRNTMRNFTVDAEAIALIPLGISQHYNDLWVSAPGVSDTAATFPDRQPSVNGAAITSTPGPAPT